MVRASGAALFFLLALMSETHARADVTKAACVDAHARAQEHRLAGRWRKAQEDLRTCAQAECPQPVTEDCTRWHSELTKQMPSVVFVAKGPNGDDTLDVHLVVDGTSIAERLPPTALELDPGEHTVTLEHSGWKPIEERIVVREGEKERKVTLRFELPSRESAVRARPSRAALPILVLGAGIVATGIGTTFGILGRSRELDLANSPCGHTGTCAPSDVDVVRRDYWILGIAGGIGLVAIGLGIWQLVTRPDQARVDMSLR
jgi:hypothetical protein